LQSESYFPILSIGDIIALELLSFYIGITMASIGWEKVGRRWRVFWHVTLPTGEIDKGSKSFKDKTIASKFKEHCEKKEKQLKRAVFVEPVYLTEALDEWQG